LSFFEALLEFLPVISLSVIVIYYILTLGTSNAARQTQIYMQIYDQFQSEQAQKDELQIMSLQWDNYEDFDSQYGHDSNSDIHIKLNSFFQGYNGLGFLMKKNRMIESSIIFVLLDGSKIIRQWEKFKPIILKRREINQDTSYLKWYEYLADEMKNQKTS
jgi:hypothetical protein